MADIFELSGSAAIEADEAMERRMIDTLKRRGYVVYKPLPILLDVITCHDVIIKVFVTSDGNTHIRVQPSISSGEFVS